MWKIIVNSYVTKSIINQFAFININLNGNKACQKYVTNFEVNAFFQNKKHTFIFMISKIVSVCHLLKMSIMKHQKVKFIWAFFTLIFLPSDDKCLAALKLMLRTLKVG